MTELVSENAGKAQLRQKRAYDHKGKPQSLNVFRIIKEWVHVLHIKFALRYSYRYLKVKVEVQQLELGIIRKLMKWCKQLT